MSYNVELSENFKKEAKRLNTAELAVALGILKNFVSGKGKKSKKIFRNYK